jgi:sporulation protein YlmC with PRC-barrel domain
MSADDDDHAIGYQALPRGVPVVTSDGETLGTVHRVQDNAREHIFDGIVVRTTGGMRFVDAPEVERITRRQVTLNIDAAEARDLPAHDGPLAGVRRPGRGWRRWLGGR